MNNTGYQPPGTFLETREYRRFAEFCDACRQHRYIGLCHGFPGVGKTLSAWHYTQWQRIQPYFPERFYDRHRLAYIEGAIARTVAEIREPLPSDLTQCRCALYTPSVTNSPKRVEQEIRALRLALNYLVNAALIPASRQHEPVIKDQPFPQLAPVRQVAEVTDDRAPDR
jgi:hypothetical protein